MVLVHEISEKKAWDEPRWNGEASVPKEQRASDAVESGVAWKTAFGAQSSKAEVGPFNVLDAGVGRKGTWRDQHLWYSVEQQSLQFPQKKRKAVVRKESAEAQDYVSCRDVESDGRKSLEELYLIPSAVGGAPPGQAHVRREVQ